ncbi:GNAT family N-acetyltransferase [Thermobifida halotolerans]|uniref:GNAT family N-acetyltransferase n=1 Tax=Thermobifida halotolerans TaxID=483545 RepID=UPI001F394589|nr:GNAT family N-acetyltransferase [Thermobifida halotolerans]
MIVEATSWDDPVGVKLRQEQEAEIIRRYGIDLERGPKPSAADMDVFLLARDAETAVSVGCGGLRRLDETTYEIKRMYVTPAWRGRRIGEVLLRALEEAAVNRGAVRMRLEAGIQQPEALRLYERCGYRRIDRFGHYVDCEESVCFERLLASSAA